MPDKIIGVLGGMGPEATVDFFAKVVSLTPAHKDQEHLRIIIDNNPKIPDRTEAILTDNPKLIVPALVETAQNLERAHADFIAIPCNTAHYFYDHIAKAVHIPVLHMIKEVAESVQRTLPNCKKIGMLGTSGTVRTNLYQKEMKGRGIEVIIPTPDLQKNVMDSILLIKSGSGKDKAKAELKRIGNILLDQYKAEGIILGCTDIPVVIGKADFSVPVFDSNLVLAEATVEMARPGSVRGKKAK